MHATISMVVCVHSCATFSVAACESSGFANYYQRVLSDVDGEISGP